MLFLLGPIPLQVAPLNATNISRSGEFSFAEHAVLGSAPVYENMGEGARSFTLKGATFPSMTGFEAGIYLLEGLEQIRRTGTPQHLLRGDGTPLGWVLITKLSEEGEALDADGVPRVIKFDVSLTVCDAPGVEDFVSIIGGFFQ